jgi:cysteine-rich repeat protein
VDVTNCPEGYIDVTFARVDGGKDGWIARAWNWVRSLFGRDATAAGYACLVPVTYSQGANGSGGERVSLRLDDLLEPDATYRFVVVEDSNLSDAVDEGVLSADAVGVAGPSDGTDETTFSTGTEMCELEEVVVEDLGVTESLSNDLVDPSVAYFTEDKEEHTVQASAKTVRGGKRVEIQEITGVYEWSWSWGSTICDDIGGAGCDVDDVVVVATADVTRTTATAAGNTGREFVIATAAFAPTNTFGETSGGVSGDLLVTANVCDNPPTIGYPYEDEVSNFSFFYCRDAGTADDASDDLPELDAPVDVTSHDDDIIQELIFKVSGTSDAIGVRVLKNDAYLRPGVWYEAHGFTGSPQEESLDGYEAVRDGNTLYVAAANHDDSSQRIYPNVYVISYTEDAGEEAQEIFDQILASWSFNSNVQTVSDVNLCAADGEYTTGYACVKGSGETTDGTCSYGDAADGTDVCPSGYACTAASSGELVACEWDGDCAESVGPSYACDADKAKLARDMRRLTDAAYLSGLVEDYGDDNGYCSVTTNLACEGDADCPGSETCEPGVPGLVTGTFVRSYSTSAWPSWTSELANALGVALPKDPINEFYACSDEGYDVETCWNAVSATFTCPDGSHVYGYRGVGGTSFDLYAQLEYGDGAWAYDFASDLGTLVMEQDWGGSSAFLKEGFVSVETFCDGATVGDSTVCGDGVVVGDEKCEIGETTGDDCDSDGDGVADGTGTITVTCASDCSAFQGAYDAESAGGLCVAYECGNGVVEEESGEECDDGSLNGTYGHCGNDCTIGSAFVCGDGYLAGGEQCDCGEVSNFASVMHDSDSWASAHCSTASNGQWIRNPALSCGWDCTAPGPSCGDGEVNGAESCDGDYEEWDGALCADGEPCDDDADCGDGSSCGDGGAACGASTVCEGGADEGVPCADASDCRSGVCGSFEYALARTRTCGALSCEWNAWNSVNGESCLGSETCGDGVVSGGEECDDGNASDTDACTTACLWNVCGDDYVYSGVESCDRGDENGEACDASYGGTCNFCSTTCTYQVMSGAYCGDGETNGTEYCDGSDMPGYCVDTASGSVETLGSCASSEFGTTDACDTDYTCRFVGVCNGGNDNGEKCTIDASSGTDTFACDGGECVVPTCSADCSGMCPLWFESGSVLAQTEEAGADAEDSIDLYGYLSGNSPDNAVFYLPACTVATAMTADIDTDNVVPPSVAVAFVTDLSNSMGWSVDGSDESAVAPNRRIDYVVEAMSEGIATLYDADLGGMSVALVGFSGAKDFTSSTWDASNGSPGYYIDYDAKDGSYLLDSTYESDLLAAAELYLTDPGQVSSGDATNAHDPRYLLQWTPTYKGVEQGVSLLDGSGADIKVLILLSDGNLTHDKDWTQCSGSSALEACVAQIRDDIVGDAANSDILFYSAAITGDDTEAGYIAHLSSDECGTDYSDEADCAGHYFYRAETAEEIGEMYEDIVDSILGFTFTLTTEADGSVETTTGTVVEGRNQVLPFPENFECTGEEMGVPFTVEFNGDGYVTIGDIQFTYCPVP